MVIINYWHYIIKLVMKAIFLYPAFHSANWTIFSLFPVGPYRWHFINEDHLLHLCSATTFLFKLETPATPHFWEWLGDSKLQDKKAKHAFNMLTFEQKTAMVEHSLQDCTLWSRRLGLPQGWDQPIVFKAQLQQSRKISGCVFYRW